MIKPLFIQKIEQIDNHRFSIEWNDKSIQTFRLSNVQRECPCARCMDEITGKRLVDPSSIREDVKAVSIRSVGRYGLKIHFTTGCSMGIFSFERLQKVKHDL